MLRSRSAFNIKHKYWTGCKLFTQMSVMYEHIWKISLWNGLFADAEPIYECHQINSKRSVQFHDNYNPITKFLKLIHEYKCLILLNTIFALKFCDGNPSLSVIMNSIYWVLFHNHTQLILYLLYRYIDTGVGFLYFRFIYARSLRFV